MLYINLLQKALRNNNINCRKTASATKFNQTKTDIPVLFNNNINALKFMLNLSIATHYCIQMNKFYNDKISGNSEISKFPGMYFTERKHFDRIYRQNNNYN